MPSPTEVFTPRQADVNEKMYVRRPALENAFALALESGMNILIHGESGCGKSWLYKQFCKERGVVTMIANLANAQRLGSITNEIANVVGREEQLELKEIKDTLKAEGGVLIAKATGEHAKTYGVGTKEPFERCLELARKKANNAPALLVLDNLEVIFENRPQMDELASLITLLDDQRYSAYKVRLLVVGIPSGVREYFNKTPNRSTIANRLRELPEVSRLTREETKELVLRGFERELGWQLKQEDRSEILHHIAWVTDRIPQRLHEYCLELANVAQGARQLDESFLPEADKRWFRASLSHTYGSVENLMNERDTKIGRRNQVLYCLGRVDMEEFRASDIELIVRQEFPTSTSGKSLNVIGMLPEIANAADNIIKRTPKGDSFMFADPRFKMALRVMLKKETGETVTRITIGDL